MSRFSTYCMQTVSSGNMKDGRRIKRRQRGQCAVIHILQPFFNREPTPLLQYSKNRASSQLCTDKAPDLHISLILLESAFKYHAPIQNHLRCKQQGSVKHNMPMLSGQLSNFSKVNLNFDSCDHTKLLKSINIDNFYAQQASYFEQDFWLFSEYFNNVFCISDAYCLPEVIFSQVTDLFQCDLFGYKRSQLETKDFNNTT